MEERNKGLVLFGIVLLAIGLVASFYSQTELPGGYGRTTYPYQTTGIILDVAGIAFIA